MATISCIKTITGEDLIGEIHVDSKAGIVNIDTPCVVVMIPGAQNQYNIGLAPYMPFAKDKKFSFLSAHIVLFFEAAEGLANEYNRITGKGIIIPSTKLSLIP